MIARSEELLVEGFAETVATRVTVAMQCGVAGCDQRVLVAQAFSTLRVNERATSIFGVVDLDSSGMVRRVTLVELSTPFEL